jgi:hypothetical protein
MDVCVVCVLYSKDKRHSRDNQDKEVVQMKHRAKKVPVEARFSVPVQSGPEAHPVSHTMGIGSLSRG